MTIETTDQSAASEPDVLNDLDEMWPELAKPDGRSWSRHEISAVMCLASVEIARLRSAIRGAQVAFCYNSPDAAMAILVETGVQNVPS